MSPPPLAELVLGGVIADVDIEHAVLGDLAEEWSERMMTDGAHVANRWYWRQAMLTIPHLLIVWWQGRSAIVVRRAAAGVLAAYLVMAILTTPGIALLGALFGSPELPYDRLTAQLARLAVGIAIGFASGAAAACVGRKAPLVSGLAFAFSYIGLSAVGMLMAGTMQQPPLYWASLLAIMPGATAAAMLVVRGRRWSGAARALA